MTDPTIARIVQLAELLDPAAMRTRIRQLRRGGLPSRSIPEGSRSSEPPMLGFDRDDVAFQRALTEYGRCLDTAHKAIRRALELETGYMPERHMTAEQWAEYRKRISQLAAEAAAPTAADCGNPNCARPVARTPDDRLRNGLCHRCYRYAIKHGYHRPASLCEQDIERQAARLADTGT